MLFPKKWSQRATNVVASKYFYGPEGKGNDPAAGGREHSVDQLIGRVATTIADAGLTQGILQSVEEAEIFQDELAYLVLNQHMAFNSPVWFNVGLGQAYGLREKDETAWTYRYDPDAKAVVRVDPYLYPQASACFIIKVDDTIDSIWSLMSESARLFKYGSGVGADWSKLRSTKEKLSGGGAPSGPVSFMRVQDKTGGTIKSGGLPRCLIEHGRQQASCAKKTCLPSTYIGNARGDVSRALQPVGCQHRLVYVVGSYTIPTAAVA